MKFQLYSIFILHFILVAIAEVPEFPNMAQWKIPLFHRREKSPVKPPIIPQIFVPWTHQQTADFVKRLEYSVQNELRDASSVGVQNLDLNEVGDEEFSIGVESDVIDELDVVDKEAIKRGDEPKISPTYLEIRPILQMHQGQYQPSPQYNLMIDGIIKQVKKSLKRREMDPLYFIVHKRGIIKHLPGKSEQNTNMTEIQTTTNTTNRAVGGGVISGLGKLKRFGNPESRNEDNKTLVRSHFSFGPLNIDFVFGQEEALLQVNSSLSSLAAHALFDVTNAKKIELLEFLIDSPMDYEIRMKGKPNRRYRSLSQTAIMRMFKRSGRMEVRLRRFFSRAASKPLSKLVKSLKNDNKFKKTKNRRKIKKNI